MALQWSERDAAAEPRNPAAPMFQYLGEERPAVLPDAADRQDFANYLRDDYPILDEPPANQQPHVPIYPSLAVQEQIRNLWESQQQARQLLPNYHLPQLGPLHEPAAAQPPLPLNLAPERDQLEHFMEVLLRGLPEDMKQHVMAYARNFWQMDVYRVRRDAIRASFDDRRLTLQLQHERDQCALAHRANGFVQALQVALNILPTIINQSQQQIANMAHEAVLMIDQEMHERLREHAAAFLHTELALPHDDYQQAGNSAHEVMLALTAVRLLLANPPPDVAVNILIEQIHGPVWEPPQHMVDAIPDAMNALAPPDGMAVWNGDEQREVEGQQDAEGAEGGMEDGVEEGEEGVDEEEEGEQEEDQVEYEGNYETEEEFNARIAAQRAADELPSTLAKRYTRGCTICMTENPLKRACMRACGHITCGPCAEYMADNDGRLECQYCRADTTYVLMFEDEASEPPVAQPAAPKRKHDDTDEGEGEGEVSSTKILREE